MHTLRFPPVGDRVAAEPARWQVNASARLDVAYSRNGHARGTEVEARPVAARCAAVTSHSVPVYSTLPRDGRNTAAGLSLGHTGCFSGRRSLRQGLPSHPGACSPSQFLLNSPSKRHVRKCAPAYASADGGSQAEIDDTSAVGPSQGGRVGFVSFLGAGPEPPVVTGQKPRAWWLLGPIVLVAALAVPHIVVPYALELMFDNVMVTDFLSYFIMDGLFALGAAAFLRIAHGFEVQRRAARGETATWSPPWRTDGIPAGFKGWGWFVRLVSWLLPLGSIFVVWSFGTGPASAAAFGPYIVGMLVQWWAERQVAATGSPVYPMVPLLCVVYRLHQLNRGSQLILELLDSISVPDPSREVLAAAGSLEAILRVLNILGLLWLCHLAVTVLLLPFLYSQTGSWHRDASLRASSEPPTPLPA